MLGVIWALLVAAELVQNIDLLLLELSHDSREVLLLALESLRVDLVISSRQLIPALHCGVSLLVPLLDNLIFLDLRQLVKVSLAVIEDGAVRLVYFDSTGVLSRVRLEQAVTQSVSVTSAGVGHAVFGNNVDAICERNHYLM